MDSPFSNVLGNDTKPFFHIGLLTQEVEILPCLAIELWRNCLESLVTAGHTTVVPKDPLHGPDFYE
jgi:hypothetical protein